MSTPRQRRPLGERAADLTRMLGPDWFLGTHPRADDEQVAKLCGPDGMGIYLEVGTSGTAKGRISISGAYPRDSQGRSYTPRYDEYPQISVAEARPVGEIAREIARRFLPAYQAAYATAQAHMQATEDQERRERALIGRLASIVGATSASHTPNEADCSIALGSNVDMHVRVKAAYDGKASLHLSRIPEEAAARILTMLNEYRTG